MIQHISISNTYKAVYIQVGSIHLLTTQTAQTIACSLVLSQVDYCTSPLSEDPYTKRFKRMLILFQIFFFSTFRLPYAGPPVWNRFASDAPPHSIPFLSTKGYKLFIIFVSTETHLFNNYSVCLFSRLCLSLRPTDALARRA